MTSSSGSSDFDARRHFTHGTLRPALPAPFGLLVGSAVTLYFALTLTTHLSATIKVIIAVAGAVLATYGGLAAIVIRHTPRTPE